MSLRDALRKAASLVVEFDDKEAPTAASEPQISATDKMWEELERAAQKPTPTASAPLADTPIEAGAAPAPVAPMVTPPAQTPSPPAAKTVEQIVREIEGPHLDQIQAAPAPTTSVLGPDGSVNFAVLYQQVGLPPAAYSAEQMLETLAALPAELPLETRRQTVLAMLKGMGKALGATPETIVADASRKLAALAAYADNLAQQTHQTVSTAESEIAALGAQIAEKRKIIEEAQRNQERLTQLCTSEGQRLDDVLEFFSKDVAPSRYAPGASPTQP
ncbi:MAG TPA: hypothetical protein VKU00_18945 [Chthonomonadaceae bacterium]|nr:hypothetical protein [Chthonomonadaceae bacterium]